MNGFKDVAVQVYERQYELFCTRAAQYGSTRRQTTYNTGEAGIVRIDFELPDGFKANLFYGWAAKNNEYGREQV